MAGGVLPGVRVASTSVSELYSSNQPYLRMNAGNNSRQGWKCCFVLCTLLVIGAVVGGIISGLHSTYNYDGSYGPVSYGPIPGHGDPTASSKPSNLSDYVWKMNTMMSRTHPCKDFYQYACGGWINDNPASDYQSHNRFANLRGRIKDVLRDLLERNSEPSAPKAVKKARQMWQSCMNTASITARGSEPLRTVLNAVGAPGVGSNSNIVDMLVKIAKYRAFPLGVLHVTTDDKDSSKTAIMLDQPNLPYRSLILKDDEYTGYSHFIDAVVNYLNWDFPNFGYQVIGDVSKLIDFQIRITQLTTDKADRPPPDVRYHKYRLGDLNMEFPGFDWKGFIKGVFSQREVDISLTDDEPVIVYAPDYFRRVGSFLKSSSKSTMYHYVQWNLIERFLPFLSKKYRTASFKVLEAQGLSRTELERWETCTRMVDVTMDNVTGRLFVDKEFEPTAMRLTKEMVADIRKVFKERMQSDSWMDSKTKQAAIEKLDAMEELIGYPPEIMDDALLDRQYDDLTIGHDYFENIVAVLNRIHWRNLKTLHQPTLRTEWEKGPTTVNAFYKPQKNIIVIPAGILRKPFFSVEYPKAMLYASLGLLVAHEMTHGFDNTGRMYDKDGSLVQWWSPEALRNYRAKEKCYVNQYSAYEIPQSHDDLDVDYYLQYSTVYLNGTKTLGENIADNGGVRDAFNAYTEWTKRQTEKIPELPYLGLTNNQVFYLAFAQRLCENNGNKKALVNAQIDVHSPGALRVKGTLQNSNHFAQTYNCAAGTKMNPRQKCRIW